MGIRTDIEWCDSTVNPTTGCDGCELWHPIAKGPCYAGKIHEGRLRAALPGLYGADFTEVRLAPDRMAATLAWPDLAGTARPGKPWLDGLPRLVFVGDMADLFSRRVPFDYIADEVVATVASPRGQRHIYMLLTKRAERMASFAAWLKARGIAWPANLWAGVSVTRRGVLGRLRSLDRVPARVRFCSFEPLLEDIDPAHAYEDEGDFWPLEWAVIGGENAGGGADSGRPCDVAWVRDLLGRLRDHAVPAFVKQLGSHPVTREPIGPGPRHAPAGWPAGVGAGYGPRCDHDHLDLRLGDLKGADWSRWPADLRVRDLPACANPYSDRYSLS
jgi:protein gp37